jgi:hypothetical protein
MMRQPNSWLLARAGDRVGVDCALWTSTYEDALPGSLMPLR